MSVTLQENPMNAPNTTAEADSLIKQIEETMVLASVTIRSPNYRIKMQKGEVVAESETGERHSVDDEMVTRPGWKWDRHGIFREIAANGTKLTATLNKYSVPGPDGLRMASRSKVPAMIQEIRALKSERAELVSRLQSHWEEVIENLRAFFKEDFYQIEPGLPTPASLRGRYDVLVSFLELKSVSGEELDLSALTADEQMEIIASQDEEIRKAYLARFGKLFDSLYGEVVEKCMEITHGKRDPKTGLRSGSPLYSGRQQSGTLTGILDVLDKVNNFSQFTSPEVRQQILRTRELISSVTPQQINAHRGQNAAVGAIHQAMGELGDQVQSLWRNQKGRVGRSLTV